MENVRLREELAALHGMLKPMQERITYFETLREDQTTEAEQALGQVRAVLGGKAFKDLLFGLGVMDSTTMK